MRALNPPLPGAHDDSEALDIRLAAILDAGFETVAGCVVLSASYAGETPDFSRAGEDETGYEAFINHEHIDDRDVPDSENLGQAMLYVGRLARELEHAFPDTEFEIIVTATDFGTELFSCTVRFHTVCEGQPTWIGDDLEPPRDAAATWRVGPSLEGAEEITSDVDFLERNAETALMTLRVRPQR